ncbi:MAG TPA: O-antigen ligase family protein [Candidatus Acidoferrales bacterium]|nr:O-antigen ligase family protein [Candidatus Acidoferrales bacterium]
MRLLRAGLCALLVFSVGAFGTVEVWSVSAVEIGAGALLAIWAFLAWRDPGLQVRWNRLNGPFLGLIAIALLQLLLHGTAYAFATREGVLTLAAYFIVFFLVAQAFRSRPELTMLAWFLACLCFGVSLFGIVQHFTSHGTIYWLKELNAGGDPFGPYVNRNHFAGFVELTAPVGLALMVFRGVRRDVFPLAAVLTILPVGALILSGSRGGIAAFAFQIGVLVLLARGQRAMDGSRMVPIGIVVLAALVLIAWLGAGKAIERFSEMRPGEPSLSRRGTMLVDTLHIFRDHPFLGTGLGTMVAVYPTYETAYDGHMVDHVHNDYAEGLAEMGILGGACGLLFLWLLLRDARRAFEAEQGHFSRAIHAAGIVAVAGLLFHSFLDFNLHIPANAMLFLVLAYLATREPVASRGAKGADSTRWRATMHKAEVEAM